MTLRRKHKIILLATAVLLPLMILFHLKSGEIQISFESFYNAIFNFDTSDIHQRIVRDFRIPRMLVTLLAGSGLAVAGLLMQTLFNNPLAGPYVLGINSGASLFVALATMSGFSFFQGDLANVSSALLGAFIFGTIILLFARHVKSHISLLLVGLMLGSFTSAFVALIQSASDLQGLKIFTMWSLGSLQNVRLDQLPVIIILYLLAVCSSFMIVKPLNNLVMGESHTRLLGFNIKRLRIIIILITALFTGLITAYCGPISFIGLAVPNIVRIAMKTQSHTTLITGCLLFGGIFLLSCDIFIQLISPYIHIPINVLTSVIGAPIVVVILLKRLA